jgi:hypothetical protein
VELLDPGLAINERAGNACRERRGAEQIGQMTAVPPWWRWGTSESGHYSEDTHQEYRKTFNLHFLTGNTIDASILMCLHAATEQTKGKGQEAPGARPTAILTAERRTYVCP